jgi:hypothetical protein
MSWLQLQTPWPVIRRKLIAGVALVSYLVATVGFPVPAVARQGGGPAYPCQDLRCGCQSAEQCWKGCCCLTPEQRWAWAREHNVEPPEYAERPHGNDNQPASPRACCAKKQSAPASQPTSAGLRWTLGLAAQSCQGSATLWISAGFVLPPTPPSDWSPVLSAAGWLGRTATTAVMLSVTPPDPPPRQCSI